MSGSTEGIKQLLKAEKQAADVVKAARNRKSCTQPQPRPVFLISSTFL